MRKVSVKKLWIVASLIVAGMGFETASLAFRPFAINRQTSSQAEAELIGTWKGDSICQVKSSPCNDEKAIYLVSKAKEAGKFTLDLGKMVNGQPESMTVVDFTYDAQKHTLICEQKYGTWALTVRGDKMEGTLTTPDKVIYRRMTLQKEK